MVKDECRIIPSIPASKECCCIIPISIENRFCLVADVALCLSVEAVVANILILAVISSFADEPKFFRLMFNWRYSYAVQAIKWTLEYVVQQNELCRNGRDDCMGTRADRRSRFRC